MKLLLTQSKGVLYNRKVTNNSKGNSEMGKAINNSNDTFEIGNY